MTQINKTVLSNIQRSFGIDIQKGKSYPEGTIRNWSGKNFQKKNGEWHEVKKQGERTNPDAKDEMRVKAILDRAKGDANKAGNLAANMANAIKDEEKLLKRSQAAINMYGEDHPISQAFISAVDAKHADGKVEGVKSKTEEQAYPKKDFRDEKRPTLKTVKKTYSWGDLITVEKGNSWKAVLHPEHQEQLSKLSKEGDFTVFKDEQGIAWNVRKVGDDLYEFKSWGQKYTGIAKIDVAKKETPSQRKKTDKNIDIHEKSKEVASHSGLSEKEYENLHPDTKKELIKHYNEHKSKIDAAKKEVEKKKDDILSFLKTNNPSNAKDWSRATGEIAEIHSDLARMYNEFNSKKYEMPNYREESPSNFNKNHLRDISKLLNLVRSEDIDQLYKYYKHWFKK